MELAIMALFKLSLNINFARVIYIYRSSINAIFSKFA